MCHFLLTLSGCPFGVVPILVLKSGVTLSESSAITRFLGRRYDLMGADELEAARCDELMDVTKDFFRRKLSFSHHLLGWSWLVLITRIYTFPSCLMSTLFLSFHYHKFKIKT
jgi:hypothetical protein